MAGEWAALSGRRRTIARQVYARDRAIPGYTCPGTPTKPCGLPIDWTLEWPDPMSRSADHIVELQDGGDPFDLDNFATLHLKCNASKGATRRWQRTRTVRRAQRAISIDPTTL